MSIAQVGIDNVDIVDPGSVNIEEQAYPRPLDPAQALVRQLAQLLSASLFAPNGPPPGFANGNVPVNFVIAGQSFTPPSFSQGSAAPIRAEVAVAGQNPVDGRRLAEFIVTPVGSFQTNASVPTLARRTILSVTNFMFNGVRFFTLNFAASVNLMDFGVDLVGTEAAFPNSAPPLAPENVPTGEVISFSTRQMVVNGTDLLLDFPSDADVVDIDISRHGDDVIFDFEDVVDVFIFNNTRPPVALTTPAESAVPGRGPNFFPQSVPTFIGTGVRIPFLIFQDLRDGVFEVENQTFGTGLPRNVFVG